jgi:hypothetical protein
MAPCASISLNLLPCHLLFRALPISSPPFSPLRFPIIPHHQSPPPPQSFAGALDLDLVGHRLSVALASLEAEEGADSDLYQTQPRARSAVSEAVIDAIVRVLRLSAPPPSCHAAPPPRRPPPLRPAAPPPRRPAARRV